MAVTIGIVALVFLIFVAAYFAASETALLRVSRIRVRYLVEKEVKNSEKLEALIEDPDRFLPALLLVVLSVQLMSASLTTWLVTRITGSPGFGVAAGTALITILMFIFGELVPKAAASHDSEKIALKVASKINIMSKVLRPIAYLFEWLSIRILKLFGKEYVGVERIVSDEGEIKAIVTAAEEHDVIEEEEKEMIHSVFEFSDTIVREVMVPRPDMVMLSGESSIKDAVSLAVERGFSRIPVYGENRDQILGIVYAKDLISCLHEGKLSSRVSTIAREALFVPETKRLSDLLKELQKRKVHMAIVVDEYGSVSGLVTIEDLIEEIVGEIFDEFDREEKLVEKIGLRKYRVDARVNVDDLNEMLSISLPKEEDVDTVGGLVMKVLGHVPAQSETFLYDGIEFVVEKVRGNRIHKVILELAGEDIAKGDK